MKRELRELDFQFVIRFEFLDTPGDEVTPGSDEIGKDFQHERFRHDRLLIFLCSNRSSCSNGSSRQSGSTFKVQRSTRLQVQCSKIPHIQ